ncbi:MAG: PDZ domain-containing protein, partial [Bacteroidales bacterium]|nr:PDZ domain-containing protein [Bacteroidales bacterium]
MKKLMFLVVCLVPCVVGLTQETRLLRFPAIYDNQIVFTYCGDLYTMEKTEETARKLTADPGFEMFARFSPDGKQIAFTGQYDGNTEVYLMSAKGGEPKRLTYTATLSRDDISDRMGPNNIVMTWTPDGKNIIYRSRKQTFNDFTGQLFSVGVEGGLSRELPLATGSWCSYSADGKQMAFNRVFREFRTWKYYRGGMADDVRIFDFLSGTSTNITLNDAQDVFPMWYGDKIFFCSDRDRIMNIFCYNISDKTTHKVTNFDFYDVKFPSAGNKEMIFENGGYLYTLDPLTEKVTKLTVRISDDLVSGRNKWKDASKNRGNSSISPDGKRLAIVGRGDIYTLPATSGITRNITQSSGAHDRNVQWSPDGKYLAYISDMDGEFEIWIQEQNGLTPPVKITSRTKTYIFDISWSPDSKKIAYSDKMMRLRYVDVQTKKVTEIERNPHWEIRSWSWSPDNKWIAYARQEANGFSAVRLYSLENGKTYPVTDTWYSSYNPVFSDDGKYLFFTSDRDFNPVYSSIEWNHSYNNMTKIYFAILSKNTPNPLGYKNDEALVSDPPKDTANRPTSIDVENLSDRILVIPGSPASYGVTGCVNGNLYYTKRDAEGVSLRMFNLSAQKDKDKDVELGKNIWMLISANKKKVLLTSHNQYYVMDLPVAKINLDKAVDLSGMKVLVDNQAEWTQIYNEAWRQMRDFFYVENMHGVDWNKMKDKYGVLLPYVKCKDDLNYLIGELIGELNVGHAYINGGDKYAPERIQTGLLGAKLERDKSGYYQIKTILKGENFRQGSRSPLTEVGMNIREGDYIVAVNGKSTKDMDDIYHFLLNTVGKEVMLSISATPDEKGKRDVIV